MFLIFTDLDGSLLDQADYSYEGARPALDRIAHEGWPLVFVTSKTRSEVEALQRRMDVEGPFVVENGAAVFFPASLIGLDIPVIPDASSDGSVRALVFGRLYSEVRRFMENVRGDFGLRGFGDMELREIAELTDLPPEDAERARAREFTEPFIMADPERLPELEAAAAARGFAITTGGRLYHLMGAGQNKGRAVRKVQEILAGSERNPVVSLGLGDSPNDAEMLEVVDHAIVIPRPDGSVMEVPRDDVVVAPEPGSRGWSSALLDVVSRLTS
ncbi:MAG: HAD-IIB family hydrolase [Gemmatimonadales bacterium]|jgi:mannosyl-3-phosphoglycerate phosphatase